MKRNSVSDANVYVTCRAGVIVGNIGLITSLEKILAATFDFYGSRRFGRERNLYKVTLSIKNSQLR